MGILSLLGLDDDDQGSQQADASPAQVAPAMPASASSDTLPTTQPLAPVFTGLSNVKPAGPDAPPSQAAAGAADPDTDTDAAPASISSNPTLRDYLLNKDKPLADRYADMASDTSGVQKAKDDAAHTKLTSGIMEGLATMFQGQGHANTGFYQQLRQDANAKVGQAQQQQQQNLANLMNVGKLDQESKVQTQQAAEWKHEKDLQDPKSDSSVALRGFMSSLGITVPDNASYADMSKVYGGVVQAHEAAEARKQAAHDSATMRAAMLQATNARTDNTHAIVSDKDAGAVADMDNAIDALKNTMALKKAGGISTGKLANTQNGIAQTFNLDDPKVTAFKSNIGDTQVMYQKMMAGARMSDQERAFLAKNMPSMADSDETFEAKTNAALARLQQKRQDLLSSLSAKGKNVSAYGNSTPPAAGGTQTPPPAPSPDDQQALEWLKANPADPHAADVTAKLKQKGLL